MNVVITPAMVGQVVISGLLSGTLYAMVALGLALIFGVMRVINIAHGPMLMLGAYATFFLYSAFGVNPYLTLPVSMAALFLIGMLLERTLVFRVVDAPELSSLLLTFGISIAVVNLAQLAFTSDLRRRVPDRLLRRRAVRAVEVAPRGLRLRRRHHGRRVRLPSQHEARQGHPGHLAEPGRGDGVWDQRGAHPPHHLRVRRGAGRGRGYAHRRDRGYPAGDGPDLDLQVLPRHRSRRRRELSWRAR